jgi:RNA polymerase sigma-70 factor (ECF subfamily)
MQQTQPASTDPNERLERLLARVSQRDHDAFELVYKLTSAHLFGVALRIVKRGDHAEEVLQDAYLNIWNQAGSYSAGLAAPMTWLISVVRNKSLDWLRQYKSEQLSTERLDDGDAERLLGAGEHDEPLALLLQANAGLHLEHCMGALDAMQRQSVALAFYDGMSHAELSLHLRSPLGTVKAWVRRGMDKLKKCLELCGIAPQES